jgi:hypothetical protein
MEQLSEAGRLGGVFHAPAETFPDVSAHGRWWVPALIMGVMGLLFVTLFVQRVGFDRMIQKTIDASPQMQDLPADKKADAIAMQRKIMPPVMYTMPVVGVLAGIIIVGGVLLFVMNGLMDAGLRFKNALNICAYSMLPASVVSSVLMVVVMFLKSPDEFDIEHPLAFNLGAFLSPDSTSKYLVSLASSFDLFTFWMIALMAIGFSAAVGAKKLPFSKALIGILIPWGVWVLCKVGLAALR